MEIPGVPGAEYWAAKSQPVVVIEGDAALAVFQAGRARHAALVGVLERLATEWDDTAAKLDAMAEKAIEKDSPQRAALLSGRSQAHADCASSLRQYLADSPVSASPDKAEENDR